MLQLLNSQQVRKEIEALAAPQRQRPFLLLQKSEISKAVLECDLLVIKSLLDEDCSLAPFGLLVRDAKLYINYFTLIQRENVTQLLIVWLNILLTFQIF